MGIAANMQRNTTRPSKITMPAAVASAPPNAPRFHVDSAELVSRRIASLHRTAGTHSVQVPGTCLSVAVRQRACPPLSPSWWVLGFVRVCETIAAGPPRSCWTCCACRAGQRGYTVSSLVQFLAVLRLSSNVLVRHAHENSYECERALEETTSNHHRFDNKGPAPSGISHRAGRRGRRRAAALPL